MIIDVTGVDVVDTMTADHFVRMIQATRLLGCHCVVTGVSPEVANTLVRLGVDLGRVQTLRSLKPGGRVVCLETAPPQNVLMEPLFRLYFFGLIPWIGGLVSGDAEAYAYLPNSTVDFPAPGAFKHEMELAGLRNVSYRTLMFGAVAIHWGEK